MKLVAISEKIIAKKILIVDDEFFITRALSFILEKEGYTCHMAHEGQDAIEQIKHNKPEPINTS